MAATDVMAASANEETPLLGGATTEPEPMNGSPQDLNDEDKIYDRFTHFEKWRILAIVSFSATLTFFAGGSFVPTIAVVAKDLGTTQANINLTVSLYMFTIAMGGLFWATYAGYYGRRPVYLLALPTYALGAFGCASSQNIAQLAVTRTIQGFGTSCFATAGVASVSDVFRLEERGTAMGIYWGSVLVGPAIAPFIGGLVSRYFSWRVMQMILCSASLLSLTFVILWLPETMHPGTAGKERDASAGTRRRRIGKLVVLNPLSALKILMSPNLSMAAMSCAIALATDYYLLIPLSYGKYYGIENEFLVGASFLPSGLGNALFAPLTGRYSDYLVIRGRKKRGRYSPEDRLKATWPGAYILLPLSVLGYGLTCEFVRGKVGIGMILGWLFINGVAVVNVMGPCGVYSVDIFHNRSAEAIATNSVFRNSVAALTAGIVLPLIQSVGIAVTGAMFAALAWIGCFLIWLIIRYGEHMRNWKDMGYTIKEN